MKCKNRQTSTIKQKQGNDEADDRGVYQACSNHGFPLGSVVKNPHASTGDTGLILALGRSPGEGNGHSLQYSCLENPMDGGAWRATVREVPKEMGHDLATDTTNNSKPAWTTGFNPAVSFAEAVGNAPEASLLRAEGGEVLTTETSHSLRGGCFEGTLRLQPAVACLQYVHLTVAVRYRPQKNRCKAYGEIQTPGKQTQDLRSDKDPRKTDARPTAGNGWVSTC